MLAQAEPTIQYLTSLGAVRAQCVRVLHLARQNQTLAFQLDETKLDLAIEKILLLMQRDYPKGFQTIPPHARWRHYEMHQTNRLTQLIQQWESDQVNAVEVTRRILDLLLVSVLLDAGAGNQWEFVEPKTQRKYNRSEGLALAALECFQQGLFSSDPTNVLQVDGIPFPSHAFGVQI
jgi:hypothetical protein